MPVVNTISTTHLEYHLTRSESISLDETLTFTGGTGINTSITSDSDTVSFNIDNTVVTLDGNQTLTSKTLTNPTTNGATLSGTLSGATSITSTGFTGALSGNATTATTLQNTTIGGVFDGSQNIDLPGVNTGGNQDAFTDRRKIYNYHCYRK